MLCASLVLTRVIILLAATGTGCECRKRYAAASKLQPETCPGRFPSDYYSRYRPGFKGVVVSLVIFSCFVHYFVLYMMYKLSIMRIKQ